MLFSEHIRTLRKQQGIMQRELAKAIGVDIPMYCRYEHGERRPKRAQVVKLAKKFKVDPDELVALWLAEEAWSDIAHDPMADRASQLLLEQLGTGGTAASPQPVPPAKQAPQAQAPEVNPLVLRAMELPASQRTLVANLDDNPMPHYVQGDALTVMRSIEDESIDCIVTTPPYWNLRKYNTESIKARTLQQFTEQLLTVMAEAHRVLKPQGSLWLNLADFYENRAMQALPWRVAISMMDLQGWIMRNDVVWNKPMGTFDSAVDHLRNVHEFLFHFVKSPDYYCDEDAWRRDYGIVSHSVEIMPADVWDIAPEKSEIERYRVAPERLCRLPIAVTCPRHGIVLDPFCGTGTTCKVAYDLDRRSIGIDVNGDRLERARRRIEQKSLSLF